MLSLLRHKHSVPAFVAAAIALSAGLALFAYSGKTKDLAVTAADAAQTEAPVVEVATVTEPEAIDPAPVIEPQVTAKLGVPMIRALERVTKKPFGIEIHPATSPVENDRFDGYHVGVDFETFEDEQETDVPVVAICEGPLLFKTFAKGYGGVAVQSCHLDGKEVSVIYGHLALASITAAPGTALASGDAIGLLGKGHSEETDGVRKHLHLGLRVGSTSDIRGYVKDPAETVQWLDALAYMDRGAR